MRGQLFVLAREGGRGGQGEKGLNIATWLIENLKEMCDELPECSYIGFRF